MTATALLAKQRLEELTSFFGINARVDVDESDEVIALAIEGSPLTPRLIGYHGETLRSIEYLVQQMVKQHDIASTRISVDVAGYREARKAVLEELARSTANKVVTTGVEAELPPMNPSERRIVHMALKERTDITTESRGNAKLRHTVIMPLTQ